MNPLKFLESWGYNKRQILAAYSEISLGKDMGDSGYGDDVDCATALNAVVQNALSFPAGGGASTIRMAQALKYSPYWREIKIWEAEAPDIVISPTEGENTGHTGLCGKSIGIGHYPLKINSNNSKTGLWSAQWTLGTWYNYYVAQKGLQMKIYRLIF